jgi:hypothetical protein
MAALEHADTCAIQDRQRIVRLEAEVEGSRRWRDTQVKQTASLREQLTAARREVERLRRLVRLPGSSGAAAQRVDAARRRRGG